MSFETSFPDEIILEICRYLHPIEILLSFGALNRRFNRTISDFIDHVHLTSVISYQNYLHLLRTILPTFWSSIKSLTINNCQVPYLTRLFLDNTEDILPPNLKKLSLFRLSINEIYSFVNRLINKSIVEELIVQCTDADYTKEQEPYGFKIAQMLLYHHPTLKSIDIYGDLVFDLGHLSFLSLSDNNDSNVRNVL